MYKPPIEIISNIENKIEQDFENNVLKVVHSYGINVDKEELIKALNYDRKQYDFGFKDGVTKILQSLYDGTFEMQIGDDGVEHCVGQVVLDRVQIKALARIYEVTIDE